MKKLSALAILIGLFFTFSVSAQIKTPKNDKSLTSEQKMLPFAMSMALGVIGQMHDEQNLEVLMIFHKQMSHWSGALKPVLEMDKSSLFPTRLDIAQAASKAISSESSESDKWQMLVGDKFGTIYAMIKKNRTEGTEINESDLKFDLEVIGLLSNSAPSDIPLDVNAKFKKFSKLKNKDNLTSDKNLSKIATEVVGILNTISK